VITCQNWVRVIDSLKILKTLIDHISQAVDKQKNLEAGLSHIYSNSFQDENENAMEQAKQSANVTKLTPKLPKGSGVGMMIRDTNLVECHKCNSP
jgi:hypothetical protein